MTSMVAELVTSRLPGTPGLALAFPGDVIVTAFLLALLFARVAVTAANRPGRGTWVHPIDVAAVTLLLAFVALAIGRIQEIVPLG